MMVVYFLLIFYTREHTSTYGQCDNEHPRLWSCGLQQHLHLCVNTVLCIQRRTRKTLNRLPVPTSSRNITLNDSRTTITCLWSKSHRQGCNCPLSIMINMLIFKRTVKRVNFTQFLRSQVCNQFVIGAICLFYSLPSVYSGQLLDSQSMLYAQLSSSLVNSLNILLYFELSKWR